MSISLSARRGTVPGPQTRSGRVTSSTSEDGRELTISISGDFVFGMHRAFHAAYRDCHPDVKFTVDLAGTGRIESAGLGMLILLARRAQQSGEKIRLINASPQLRRVLVVCRFADRFDLHVVAGQSMKLIFSRY